MRPGRSRDLVAAGLPVPAGWPSGWAWTGWSCCARASRTSACSERPTPGRRPDAGPRPYRRSRPAPHRRGPLDRRSRFDDDEETLGDRFREALGADASATRRSGCFPPPPTSSYPLRPRSAASERKPEQKNLLVRVVLRDLDKTLTNETANALRDRIYRAIHQGTAAPVGGNVVPMTAVLDHLAIGTPALTDGWELFGGVLGGTWAYGMDSPGYWWGQLEFAAGPKIELLTPTDGPDAAFLERFLAARRQGPHHFNFLVSDIHDTLARVRALGIEPVGVNLDNPYWQEKRRSCTPGTPTASSSRSPSKPGRPGRTRRPPGCPRPARRPRSA